jgi:glutaconate CoA-transferase subunit A
MMDHLDRYVAQVNADPVAGFDAFMEEFIHGPANWTEFLEKIGLPEILAANGRGRSIHFD